MKQIYILLVFFIAFLSNIEAQQQDIQSFIQKGIELHSEGEFQKAIEKYNEALQIDSTNILALYEISLSYLALENYENAIKFSTKVLDSDDQTLSVGVYAVKSEALAAMDKIDEAIELLENGLEKYPNEYILHFNLALNYYKKNNLDKTLFHVSRAIDLDKSHSEAFLLNAYVLNDKEQWIKSILSFQMFLLLEPDNRRSRAAFDELLRTMHIRVPSEETVQRSFTQQQPVRTQEQTGYLVSLDSIPPLSVENGVNRNLIFNAVATSIDSLQAASQEEDLFMVFKTVNREIIRLLDEENDGSESKTDKFWTFYVPFFAHIANSEHYETYCRYISVSFFPESLEWWHDNPEEAENFVIWFEEGDEDLYEIDDEDEYEYADEHYETTDNEPQKTQELPQRLQIFNFFRTNKGEKVTNRNENALSSEIYAQRRIAMKTNIPYWTTLSPNVGIEIVLKPHLNYTFELSGGFNPFKFSDNKQLKHGMLWAEVRHWTRNPFDAHFFGLHYLGGRYNVGGVKPPFGMLEGAKNKRANGNVNGLGLSYGYSWIIGNNLAIETTMGLGYARFNYDVYSLGENGMKTGEGRKNYFGPTKGAISLVYIFP
jgi:tetratricopeptide (TPR) repeat protein